MKWNEEDVILWKVVNSDAEICINTITALYWWAFCYYWKAACFMVTLSSATPWKLSLCAFVCASCTCVHTSWWGMSGSCCCCDVQPSPSALSQTKHNAHAWWRRRRGGKRLLLSRPAGKVLIQGPCLCNLPPLAFQRSSTQPPSPCLL